MNARSDAARLRILLVGDVMLGRGIDQILPRPGDPELRERAVHDAREYVALAEAANGTVPWPVDPVYPWGDALAVLDELAPDARILNLETSITRSDDFAAGKAVHYRMSPDNLACLTAARPDVCVLANNHVLDFGRRGLVETLATLDDAGLTHAGAGGSADDATAAAVAGVAAGRVVLSAVGTESSGVPSGWAATAERGGVAFLPELSVRAADSVLARVQADQCPGDVTVVSVHAGSNWGYPVPHGYRRFARRLVDGGVDVVHGHSSHHPRPVEIYRGRPILYGCGDLVNDYEGIGGWDEYRSELRLLYLVTLDAGSHELVELRMVPLRARRLRLERATAAEVDWLRRALDRVSRAHDTVVLAGPDHSLVALPS
ncbi:MAG TPA: CapA family protein [Nocardioides sp.]|uniref:CapA family protein n=1 Tax=Nocardioides sp. TaxID=35761 RepID=UPI002D7E9135|nr:CapA family protein [Nocardioides sp.]HET6652193.1 CapA family protein [Nocardioides sp.]